LGLSLLPSSVTLRGMEMQEFSECAKCTRILFPGDEGFRHSGEVYCSLCHEGVSTRFAGISICT
jgi:hypothetical protein